MKFIVALRGRKVNVSAVKVRRLCIEEKSGSSAGF